MVSEPSSRQPLNLFSSELVPAYPTIRPKALAASTLMHRCRLAAKSCTPLEFGHRSSAQYLVPQSHLRRQYQRVNVVRHGKVGDGVCSGEQDPPTAPPITRQVHGNAALLSPSQLLQARKYVRLVLEQNTTMNLTGTESASLYSVSH